MPTIKVFFCVPLVPPSVSVRGSPLYYVERQGIYAAIGLVVAIGLSRIDYSRLREYKYGMYGPGVTKFEKQFPLTY